MSEVFADRELAAWVTMIASSDGELDVQAMRAATAERARTRARGPELDSVRDVAVGELRARLYRPGEAALPVVLYLHGGGWTIGSIETHDRLCRRLADGSGAAVLSLDYRLPRRSASSTPSGCPIGSAGQAPGVGPLFAPDVSGLPPALIVAAEHDPLREESAAYAERLSSAGVDVDYRCEPGLVHNFMMLDDTSPVCAAAADRVAADLRARLVAG